MFRRGRPVDGAHDGFVYDGTIAQRPYIPLPDLLNAAPTRDSLGANGRMPTYDEAVAADPELVKFLTRAWQPTVATRADTDARDRAWAETVAGGHGMTRGKLSEILRDPNPSPEAVRFLQMHRRAAKARLRDRDHVALYRGSNRDPLESYDHVTGLGNNRAKGAPVLSWTSDETSARRWGDEPYKVDVPVDNVLSWNTFGNQSEFARWRPSASRGDEILAATNPEVIRRIERGDAPFVRESDHGTLPDPADPTRTLVDRVLTDGGFTVDTTDGDAPSTGYIVAIPGHSFIATREAFEADGQQQIRDYVRAIREDRAFRAQYGEVMFGGWHDTEHDEVVLDRVEHFADREDAIAAGMARNEQAIWDVAAGAEIPTGGTGGREDVDIVGEVPTLTGRWRRLPDPQTPADMVQVLGSVMGNDPLELGTYSPRDLGWIRSFRPLASDDDLTAALDAAVAEGVVEEVGVDGERRWRLPRPPHVVVRDEAMAAKNAGAVPVLARVADNRMKRGGLNKGDVVSVEFATAYKAKVTIETSNGKRSYRVQWDRFEPVPDGWEPPVERDESFNKFFDPARQAEVVAEVADVLRRIPNRHDPDAALAAVNARYPGLVEAAEGGTAEHAATVAGVLARAAMRVEFDAPNGPPVETLVNTDFGDYVESMAASQLPGLRLLEADEIQAYQLDELVDATMGESPLMARMAEAYGWPILTNISIPNADVGGFTVHEALNIRAGASAIGINVDGDYPDGPSNFGPVDRSALSVIVDRSRRGVVRHEYGHFMDAVLVNVGIVDGGSPTSRRAARRAVIQAFQLDWPTSAMRQVSRYAGSSHSELLAEGWTAISHPDYPAWKLTLTNQRDLERWNLMESYFNPDGVPFYPWNETVLPVPELLAPNPPVPVPSGGVPVPVPTGGTP